MPGVLQVVVGSSNFSFQLWWEVPPCVWLLVPRRCSNEHGEMEVMVNVVGGSRASTRMGKEVQSLPSVDMDVPSVDMDVSCLYTKEKTSETVAVEKTAEEGDFLGGIKRGTIGK